MTYRESSLEGSWFHSKNEDGDTHWQGQFIEFVTKDLALVELYSWMTGTPTCKKLVSVNGMVNWDFYNTADEMRHNYREEDL